MNTRPTQVCFEVSPSGRSQKRLRALGSLIAAVGSSRNWEADAETLLSHRPGSDSYMETLAKLFPLHVDTLDWEGVKFAMFAVIGAPEEDLDEGLLYTLVGHMTVASKHIRAIAIRRFRNIWEDSSPPVPEGAVLSVIEKPRKTHNSRRIAEVAQV